jgi:hypothetical protein
LRPDLTAGSTIWQTVFISFAIVLILFEAIRGWRLGVLRQLVRVGAIVAAYTAAFFGGKLLLPLLRPILRMPDIVLSALAGALLALMVYAIIAGLGSILFKRTAQQNSGAVRLVYGMGGAIVGLLIGGFFIWFVLLGIRLVGSVAEAQVRAQAPRTETDRNPATRFSRRPLAEPTPAPLSSFDAGSVLTFLARLKNSVELGAVGDALKKGDAMRPGVYQTLSGVGTVFADPETAQRFLSFPGARELGQHPRIVALRTDPEIAEMIAQGRLIELMRDPRVVAAINDPALIESMKKFDLQKALEYAGKKD